MKLLMILGGAVGFVIGFGLSWLQDVTWPSAIVRASLSAYVAGLLMRWWGQMWVKSWHQTLREREAAGAPSPAAPVSTPSRP